jgi:hypothetical protein
MPHETAILSIGKRSRSQAALSDHSRGGRVRRALKYAAAVAAFALCMTPVVTTATAGTAMAADGWPVGTFTIWSGSSPYYCMQEDGDTSAVYLGSCSSNHSDYWLDSGSVPNGDTISNDHSGLCLNETFPSVDVTGCSTAFLAQLWVYVGGGVDGGGLIINSSTDACLWQSNTSIQQRACDPSNVHDTWGVSG